MKFESFQAGALRQVNTPTAYALIRDFEELGMLQEITGQQRGWAYAFDRYLQLFVS